MNIPHAPMRFSPADLADITGPQQIWTLMRLGRECAPLFRLRVLFHRFVMASGFEAVDELCDHRRFRKVIRGNLAVLRDLASDGLFTAHEDEPNWRKAHSILSAGFSLQAIRNYVPGMIEVAESLVARWERAADAGDVLDVTDEMTRAALDVIGLCGFGFRFDCLGGAALPPFVERLRRCLSMAPERAMGLRMPHMPMPGEEHWDEDIHAMNEVVDAVIAARRNSTEEHADLLGVMLAGVDRASGEQLDDRNIRHQILTLLVAGHDTTSGLLSFAIYFLLNNAEVLERARDEVDRVLGRGRPDFQNVQQLRFLVQVLKESMRLWSPAPGFHVAAFEDTVICGRYRLQRDEAVTIFVPSLHRDPTVWGSDAEQFDPDRFAPAAEKSRPANAYRPFGNGPRACAGQLFAMQEALLLLAVLLQRFHLIECEAYTLQLQHRVTLKPRDFRIKVQRR